MGEFIIQKGLFNIKKINLAAVMHLENKSLRIYKQRGNFTTFL